MGVLDLFICGRNYFLGDLGMEDIRKGKESS